MFYQRFHLFRRLCLIINNRCDDKKCLIPNTVVLLCFYMLPYKLDPTPLIRARAKDGRCCSLTTVQLRSHAFLTFAVVHLRALVSRTRLSRLTEQSAPSVSVLSTWLRRGARASKTTCKSYEEHRGGDAMSQRVGPGTGRKRGHQHHPRNQGTRRAPVPATPTLSPKLQQQQQQKPSASENVIDLTACDDDEETPQTKSTEDMSLIFRPAAEGSSQSDQEAEEDPELEELARLRCTSERTEVVAERETRRRNRRCADYPGLAFGSSIFSSDTLMKFSIIRNELHNIMNTQLKRVRVFIAPRAARYFQFRYIATGQMSGSFFF